MSLSNLFLTRRTTIRHGRTSCFLFTHQLPVISSSTFSRSSSYLGDLRNLLIYKRVLEVTEIEELVGLTCSEDIIYHCDGQYYEKNSILSIVQFIFVTI